ncbi:MAG TPA: carbohydrate binding domain-containing protein, partial [Herpetosiphonaceae bacterium]|nr:carbohydrate binding domain-containing protein [Herpetosiphonaceae bacterium]
EYKLTDNFVGWKRYDIPWSGFTRRADWQPAGAPNDGFTRTGVGGYNLGFNPARPETLQQTFVRPV